MSIKVMQEVWEHSKATGSAHHLLLAIADNANEQGIAWPSLATLARKTRISERQVRRLIRQLEMLGELVTHIGGDGQFSSSTYRVSICPPNEAKADMGVRGRRTNPSSRRTNPSFKADMGVPQTVIEPSIEPSSEPLIAGTQKDNVTWWKNRYERKHPA